MIVGETKASVVLEVSPRFGDVQKCWETAGNKTAAIRRLTESGIELSRAILKNGLMGQFLMS